MSKNYFFQKKSISHKRNIFEAIPSQDIDITIKENDWPTEIEK